MRGPLDLSRGLLEAEVLHEIVHLRRRIDDAAELPEALDVPAQSCLEVHLYDSDAGLLAALLPTGTNAATTALALVAGARSVRPTDRGRVSAVTDYHPGLVPPIGLPGDVLVVADVSLRDQEVVYAAAGDGSTALKIRAQDLLGLTGALVTPLVEPGATVENAWRDEPLRAPTALR